MLYLNEKEIESLIDMPNVMRVVDECFRLQGKGMATNQPRRRVYVPNGMMHVMFASLIRENEGFLGLKTYTAYPSVGVRFIFLLWDANSSELLSLMEANLLGQLRTGAASGIAAKPSMLETPSLSHSTAIIAEEPQHKSDIADQVRLANIDACRRDTFANQSLVGPGTFSPRACDFASRTR